MEKRTIRVTVVDRDGRDHQLVQKALSNCGLLHYAVDRAADLESAFRSVTEGVSDCCLVDSECVAATDLTDLAARSRANQRPLVFLVDERADFTPPDAVAAMEAARLSRNSLTVPHLVLAIRQAMRPNLATGEPRPKAAMFPSMLSGMLRPAY